MPSDLENGLVLGTPVYVIGYPGGTALSISTAQNGIVDFDRRFVHYMANTAPGSTGSAVFDENWRFIAMHHAARPGDDGRRIGEGVRTDAIARESAGRFD